MAVGGQTVSGADGGRSSWLLRETWPGQLVYPTVSGEEAKRPRGQEAERRRGKEAERRRGAEAIEALPHSPSVTRKQ